MCNEGQCVTIPSTPITGTVYGRFRQILLSKATSQLSLKFSDSLWMCFIVVGLFLLYLNTLILKTWGSASHAQRPLMTGIVRRQFLSLRGTTWHNNGRGMWNGCLFEHICAFYMEITFTGWNWKCHVIIMIKTNQSGFVVPMHLDLCEQYVKFLWLTPSGLTSCFSCTLMHWDNKAHQNRS